MRLPLMCMLTLLLCTGCHFAIPQEAAHSTPQPSTAPDADDLARRAFLQGIEESESGNLEILMQLSTSEPHTVWGQAAGRILSLNQLHLDLEDQIKDLRLQIHHLEKDSRQQRQTAETKYQKVNEENRRLQDKLNELTQVLVELEKHAR